MKASEAREITIKSNLSEDEFDSILSAEKISWVYEKINEAAHKGESCIIIRSDIINFGALSKIAKILQGEGYYTDIVIQGGIFLNYLEIKW